MIHLHTHQHIDSHLWRRASMALAAAVLLGMALSLVLPMLNHDDQAVSEDPAVIPIITEKHKTSAVYERRDFRKLDADGYSSQLHRLQQLGFNTLYLSLDGYIEIASSGRSSAAQEAQTYREELRQFVAYCRQQGMMVAAITGDRHWAGADPAVNGRYAIEAVHSVNSAPATAGAVIQQLQLDIDPSTAPGYQADKTGTMTAYLKAAENLYAYQRQLGDSPQQYSLGFAFPTWTDSDGAQAVQIGFNGTVQPAAYQLIDLAAANQGAVALLADSDSLDGPDGANAQIAGEMRYAGSKPGAKLYVVQQITDSHASGQPGRNYHSKGLADLMAAANGLHQQQRGNGAYEGVIVNDAISLIDSLPAD